MASLFGAGDLSAFRPVQERPDLVSRVAATGPRTVRTIGVAETLEGIAGGPPKRPQHAEIVAASERQGATPHGSDEPVSLWRTRPQNRARNATLGGVDCDLRDLGTPALRDTQGSAAPQGHLVPMCDNRVDARDGRIMSDVGGADVARQQGIRAVASDGGGRRPGWRPGR